MTDLFSRQTEILLEERAKALGLESTDQLVRFALDALESNLFSPDDLDEETWAAIEAADESGEGVRWEEFKREWLKKLAETSMTEGGDQ